MKKFTTSAQKTLTLPKDVILKMLADEMSKDAELVFEETKSDNIRQATLKDGSTLVIAGFDKENGKTLAMIDYKNVSANFKRAEIQSKLRQKLDKFLKNKRHFIPVKNDC